MRHPFEAGIINGMMLKNRFVRSATWEGLATVQGACTPKLLDMMVKLAEGEVGLIITSHAYVEPQGQAGPWQLGIYSDGLVPGLKEMTRAVHDKGGTMVMQIAHAGHFANPQLTGGPALAPSVSGEAGKTPRRAITPEDIQRIVGAFGRAAGRAKEAGFDGVQIHSAHGYLLSQFLSPAFNQRTDEYGGAIENRVRIHREVLQAVRKAVGKDYPVLIKLNSQDFVEKGLILEDSLQAGKLLAEDGLDAIEVSGGLLSGGKLSPSRMGIKTEEAEAYFKTEATAFRKAVKVPLILVGGIRSYSLSERILADGVADYVSLCRPLIREPDLIRRWKDGDRRRATCLSDNQCFGPAVAGEGISCVHEKKGS